MEHGHGPGSRYPGIIVRYNCVQFSCEPDLVQRLEDIVRRYPTYTYLAPYPGMDAEIALTTQGKLEVLEELDEGRIVQFIERTQGP